MNLAVHHFTVRQSNIWWSGPTFSPKPNRWMAWTNYFRVRGIKAYTLSSQTTWAHGVDGPQTCRYKFERRFTIKQRKIWLICIKLSTFFYYKCTKLPINLMIQCIQFLAINGQKKKKVVSCVGLIVETMWSRFGQAQFLFITSTTKSTNFIGLNLHHLGNR